MNISNIDKKIKYCATLIFTILVFIGMHNNSFQTQYLQLIFLSLIYLLNHIAMYSMFYDDDKKYRIKQILKFYAIVFMFSFLDILLYSKYMYGSNIKYNLDEVVLKIVLALFPIIALIISNYCIIEHIKKYKEGKRCIKSFASNLILYAFKCSTSAVIISLLVVALCIFAFKEEVPLSTFIYLAFLIVIVFVPSIVIYLLVYLLSSIKFYKYDIRTAFTKWVAIIIIALPLCVLRKDLLAEAEHIIYAITDNDNMLSDFINSKKELYNKKKEEKETILRKIEGFKIVKDLKNAEVGDLVVFGKSFLKSNIHDKIDNYYYVYEKNGDELTLLSFYIIDELKEEDLLIENGEYKYKKYLDTTFYENAFGKEEKKCIVEKTYEDGKRHKVYIPNYKFYLYDKFDDSRYEDLMHRVTPSIKIYEKLGFDRKIFSIVLSETKLKPGFLRLAVYRDTDKYPTVDDYLPEKYKGIVSKVFLRPIITVKINK